MKASPGIQWIVFGIGITLLMLVIAWISVATWHRLSDLRRDLGTLQAESFHLADHLEAEILSLNETLLRYDAHRQAEELAKAQQRGTEVGQWIEQQIERVKTKSERELLGELGRAFQTYHSRVLSLVVTNSQSESIQTPLVDSLEKEAVSVMELCKQFDEAQQGSLENFGRASHATASLLQRLLLVGAVLLVCLSIVVVSLIYRSSIAPLRAKLGEVRGIAERHEKLASLGTLAAGVAHEIRNPLTAINVRLHSLKKALGNQSSQHEDAVVIGSEIQRLERIVRDFLQFARPSEPELIETNAASLLKNVYELFHAQFEQSGIVFKLEAAENLQIKVDPQQIEQVLINLVRNAAESCDKSGYVLLRAFASKVSLRRNVDAIALEVSDSGGGIPPEVRKRLFDPFYTTKPTGTGLGLSIAARIVENHGGSIQYRSETGKGTTFVVLLPASV